MTCAEDQKWVTYVADLPVARIGDATYGSLQEALDAGGEITLLRDVGSDAEPVATGLLVGKDVTLDLAGFAIVGRADGADVRFRLFRLDHDANLTIVGTGSVRVYGGEGAANGGILFAGCGRVSILGEVDCYAENYLYLREDLTCLSIEAQSGRFKTGACSWRSLSRDYNWIDYDNHHYEWDVEGWQIVVPGAARISMNIEEMKDLFRGDVLAMLAELVETNQWGDWDFSITLETDSASAPVSRICLWRSTDYSNDTEGLIGEQEDISAASFLELISYLAERLLDDAPPTRATYDRLYAQLVAKTCPSALLRSTGTSILE